MMPVSPYAFVRTKKSLRVRTDPKHWLDFVPGLRPFFRSLSVQDSTRRTDSRCWDWSPWMPLILDDPSYAHSRVKIPGDMYLKSGNIRRSSCFSGIDDWRKAVILEGEGAWRLGYCAADNQGYRAEVCSVLLEGTVAALVGPSDTVFFAVSKESYDPVRLRVVVEHANREDVPEDILLL